MVNGERREKVSIPYTNMPFSIPHSHIYYTYPHYIEPLKKDFDIFLLIVGAKFFLL